MHYRKILLSRQKASFGTSMIATDDLTTLQSATEFQNILNQQDPNIQYTLDVGDKGETLQFLDLKITSVEGKKNMNLEEKRHHQCTSKTSLWTWSKDTQGHLNWFSSQSIHYLSINPTWKRSGLPDQALLKMDTTTTSWWR